MIQNKCRKGTLLEVFLDWFFMRKPFLLLIIGYMLQIEVLSWETIQRQNWIQGHSISG